jgi:hypothetical protein
MEYDFMQELTRLLNLFDKHMKPDAGLRALQTDRMALLKLFNLESNQVLPQNRDFAKKALGISLGGDERE